MSWVIFPVRLKGMSILLLGGEAHASDLCSSSVPPLLCSFVFNIFLMDLSHSSVDF